MIAQAGLFLLDALISFLSAALLLRFYMQAFRVSFSNQAGNFIVQLTNWLVKPLRKLLPGLWPRSGQPATGLSAAGCTAVRRIFAARRS